MAIFISLKNFFLLFLCVPSFSLKANIQNRGSADQSNSFVFECCSLDPVGCNSNVVNTSRWLKGNEEYREIQGNRLILGAIQDEGFWRCALKFVNDEITDWSKAKVYFSTKISSEQQEILVNARSKRIEYQYKFKIGKLTQEQKIQSVGLYIIRNSLNLLANSFGPRYSLMERIVYNGNSLLLNNFSVMLNWTQVQDLFVNNTLIVGLRIRLRRTTSSIISTAVLTLDCTKKEAHEVDVFLLNFTNIECLKYEDTQVIQYLLTENTCLKSDFNVTMTCNKTNQYFGILQIFSLWTIQLQSVQMALQTIAQASPQDPQLINSSLIEDTGDHEFYGSRSPTETTSYDIRIISTGSYENWFIIILCLLSLSILITLFFFTFGLAFFIMNKNFKANLRTRDVRSTLPNDTLQMLEVSNSHEKEEAEHQDNNLRSPLLDEHKSRRQNSQSSLCFFLSHAVNRDVEETRTEQMPSSTLDESVLHNFNNTVENNHLREDNLSFEATDFSNCTQQQTFVTDNSILRLSSTSGISNWTTRS